MKKTIKSNAKLIDYCSFLSNESNSSSHSNLHPYLYSNTAYICKPLIEKSFSSQTNDANISNSMRIANIITSSLGGRTQFGNNGILEDNTRIGIGLGPRNKF